MSETRCWDAQMIQHMVISSNLLNNYITKTIAGVIEYHEIRLNKKLQYA